MDSSGRATLSQAARNDAMVRGVRWQLIAIVAPVALTLAFLTGCAGTVEMGRLPEIGRLDNLVVNVSLDSDVRAALGAPQGRGAVRAPSFGSKDVWTYGITRVEGSTARTRMLFVFLDRETGIYRGYMWFGSGMLIAPER